MSTTNNNENIDDLVSISIEMDENKEKKEEKEKEEEERKKEERKRKNKEATLRCRKQKKEKKEKKKKYLEIYKGVKELAKFNNKNENEIKKELGIKTNRKLVNIFDEEDYRRQESLRDRTHHREELERIFGDNPRPLEVADEKYEEELKKFERNQRRRINYAKQKQNMLALFAQDRNKKEQEEIIKEEKLMEIRAENQKKKMPEIIAGIRNFVNNPDRWAKQKEKEEEERRKKEEKLIKELEKYNIYFEKKEKKPEKNEKNEEKDEEEEPKEEPKDEEKPENKEEKEEVEEEDDDEPTFREENGEFVVLNNKKFFAKINKNQLFNKKI